MSGNQSYDNRSTHDMFRIIEGQTMESISNSCQPKLHTVFVCLWCISWDIVDHSHDRVYCNPLKVGVS